MEPSLPWSVLKSMVRIEEGESTMLDLSTSTLSQRNTEYVVAFFKAIAAAKPIPGRGKPSAIGLTIRCRFNSLRALIVLCDYLVSKDCQIKILILSLTNLKQQQVHLLFTALSSNQSVKEFAIYATKHNEETMPLAGASVRSLLEKNKGIQKLTLVRLHLPMECYREIAKGLTNNSLCSLSLDSSTIHSEATEILLQALTTTSTINHLHLGYLAMSKRALEFVVALVCRKGSTLKEVSIVDPLVEVVERPLNYAGLLAPDSSIEKLTLDSCAIKDDSATLIFSALERNETLRDLNMPRNFLSQSGYFVMLNSMKHWSYLWRLGVDGGGELLSCQEHLIQGMRSNRSLHHLGLETFELGPYNPHIRAHTRRFLRRNRRLDKVRKFLDKIQCNNQAEQSLPPGLWPHILKSVSCLKRDGIEVTELYQVVSTHAVGWPVFQRSSDNAKSA